MHQKVQYTNVRLGKIDTKTLCSIKMIQKYNIICAPDHAPSGILPETGGYSHVH